MQTRAKLGIARPVTSSSHSNEMTRPPVRVRFAPSPTGSLHLGSALVALANAAHARAGAGGTLVLRIDDTDMERSSTVYEHALVRLLGWLGIEWDEGPFNQSERLDTYASAIDALLTTGAAYPCFCSPERLEELQEEQRRAGEPPRYDGRCLALDPSEASAAVNAGAPHVLRMRTPDEGDITFLDLVRGQVRIPARAFGDPVLCRTDGSPGYLLASVVDDLEFDITHIIRGEDHLVNTAKQLLLMRALGATTDEPRFAHLPLLRDEDGRKLSKRSPLGTLDELADAGYLARSVRRYLAELLGQYATDLLEPGAPFDLTRVPIGAPRVDRDRLDSIAREDMASIDVEPVIATLGVPAHPALIALTRELAPDCTTVIELRGELQRIVDGPGTEDLPIILGELFGAGDAVRRAGDALGVALEMLRAAGDGAEGAELQRVIRASGADAGFKAPEILRPVRAALSGSTGGPPLGMLIDAIGTVEAIGRVHRARRSIERIVGGNLGTRG